MIGKIEIAWVVGVVGCCTVVSEVGIGAFEVVEACILVVEVWVEACIGVLVVVACKRALVGVACKLAWACKKAWVVVACKMALVGVVFLVEVVACKLVSWVVVVALVWACIEEVSLEGVLGE